MTSDPADFDLTERIPLTNGAQIAHLLGRIETTLIEMRRDIQAGTQAQLDTATHLAKVDLRVISLEGERDTRKRHSRIYGIVALTLLVPGLHLIHQLHGWFDAVNDTCFPRR